MRFQKKSLTINGVAFVPEKMALHLVFQAALMKITCGEISIEESIVEERKTDFNDEKLSPRLTCCRSVSVLVLSFWRSFVVVVLSRA